MSDSNTYRIDLSKVSKFFTGFQSTMPCQPPVCCGSRRDLNRNRFQFLLCVFFDMGFIGIMWLLATVIGKSSDSTIAYAFKEQTCPHYWSNDTVDETCVQRVLEHSLFDIMALSFIRFIWLVLIYGIVQLNHWWPAALTVLYTTVYIGVKIFLYSFLSSVQAINIAMLVCSFILAWLELWLVTSKGTTTTRVNIDPESQTDIANLTQHDVLAQQRRLQAGGDRVPESDAYYSPEEALSSEEEEDQPKPSKLKGFITRKKSENKSPAQNYTSDDYIFAGKEAMELGTELYEQSSSWKRVSADSKDVELYSHTTKKYGKCFLIKTVFNASIDTMCKLLYTDIEHQPTWNKTVLKIEVLARVNESLDVVYSISAPSAGGVVDKRDFIDIRLMHRDGDVTYIAAKAINSSIVQPKPKIVRGENGPNLFVLQPTAGNKCTFHWVMNTNLKGKLPKRLVDNALNSFLNSYIGALRNEVARVVAQDT